jgi:hypothetical protein
MQRVRWRLRRNAAACLLLGALAAVLVAQHALTRNPPVELMSRERSRTCRTCAPGPAGAMAMELDLEESFRQETCEDFPVGSDGLIRYPHLALSGSGPNGAFGAGLLNGWTSTGQRPVFKIVTGVSTGALMAPFAFVGSSEDEALREFYTTTKSSDIFTPSRSLLRQLLSGEALADTGPLAALIAKHVDAEFLRQVAQAHARTGAGCTSVPSISTRSASSCGTWGASPATPMTRRWPVLQGRAGLRVHPGGVSAGVLRRRGAGCALR